MQQISVSQGVLLQEFARRQGRRLGTTEKPDLGENAGFLDDSVARDGLRHVERHGFLDEDG